MSASEGAEDRPWLPSLFIDGLTGSDDTPSQIELCTDCATTMRTGEWTENAEVVWWFQTAASMLGVIFEDANDDHVEPSYRENQCDCCGAHRTDVDWVFYLRQIEGTS